MTSWFNLAVVATGGACGAVSRYLITLAAAAVPGGSSFWGTAIANILGCAAIGALAEYSLMEKTLSMRASLALRVGFLGSLTTFSTFAAESVSLAESGRIVAAGAYVAANLLIGWGAIILSAVLVRAWLT